MSATDANSRDWAALMRAGRFEEAWRAADWSLEHARRPQSTSVPRHLQTIWDGTPIQGRHVFVRCYHGLGDTLQFLRYLPLVQRIAASTTVWIQPALIDLVRPRLPGIRLLPLDDGDAPVTFDVEVEVMELAHVFRSTAATLPPPLFAGAAGGRRRALAPPVVGLRWTAGAWDPERGLSFHEIERLLAIPNVQFVPLEERVSDRERDEFAEAPPELGLAHLAAAIMRCDLVIAVDGMAAHLAGSLTVPTWTLLKHDADWRWLSDRLDSPWYPSMRLYRQATPRAWAPVIERVRADLISRRSRTRPVARARQNAPR